MKKLLNAVIKQPVRLACLGLIAGLLTFATPGALMAQATKITSTEGRYNVIFPAPAERKVNPPISADGEPLGFGAGTTVTYSVELYTARLDNQLFVTAYTRYTGDGVYIDAEKELQQNRDNFINGVKGVLTSSTKTEYVLPSAQKIPGLEFAGETDEWMLHGRYYVSGNDVWGIVYLARKGHESTTVRDQFYRSLEVRP